MVTERACLWIDLAALVDNWRTLARRQAPGACGAVVKANAYGLGMQAVVEALQGAGCRHFFVSNPQEGVALRQHLNAVMTRSGGAAGLSLPTQIYVLQGVVDGEEPLCEAWDLIPVLVSLPMARRWWNFSRQSGRSLASALKFNTGMNRLGLSEQELAEVLDRFPGLVADTVLLMSHLACADEPDHPLNALQLQRFSEALHRLRQLNPNLAGSLANSSGLYLPHPRFDLARPGAGLYGVNPCPGLPHPLKPVVSLALPVLQVQLAQAGDYVGYGAQTRLERASRLVVVAGGYADGFFRAAFPALKAYADDSVGQVHALPLAGRVSMDALVFDATDCPDLREGMQVRLLGPEQTVDALAAAAGTIGYEVLTGLGERLRRRYLPVLP